MTDYTISTDTWWTSGAGSGADDGSSLADRTSIPTDIDALTINGGKTLYLVSETGDGHIELGHDTNDSKLFKAYGDLVTIDSSGDFSPTAYDLYIGGSSAHDEGYIYIFGQNTRMFNTHFHQLTDGTATGDATAYTYLNNFNYFEGCTFKSKTAYPFLPQSGGYFKDTIFYGGNSGTGYCLYPGATKGVLLILDGCSQNTSGTYFSRYYSFELITIGGFTKAGTGGGSIYLLANEKATHWDMRKAFITVKDASANALTGVSFGAYESTGTFKQLNTAGVTGADGKCNPIFMHNTDGEIPCLDKMDFYYRATNGAKTWGTPDSTTDYGDYTFMFYKSGYQAKTETHDFTDGSDWGSSGTAQVVTLSTAGSGGGGGRQVHGMM